MSKLQKFVFVNKPLKFISNSTCRRCCSSAKRATIWLSTYRTTDYMITFTPSLTYTIEILRQYWFLWLWPSCSQRRASYLAVIIGCLYSTSARRRQMYVHQVHCHWLNAALYDVVLILAVLELRLNDCHACSSIATRLSSLALQRDRRPANDTGKPVIERLFPGQRDRRRAVFEACSRSSDRDRLGGIGRGAAPGAVWFSGCRVDSKAAARRSILTPRGPVKHFAAT